MGISIYIKEIGRGAKGARPLRREQAADLLGQILDGECSDLEVGAFCLAMRIKGETPEELAGFLDAVDTRIAKISAIDRPVVIIPSYNGARKQPVLTPLLGLLLAREGFPVMLHGTATENSRVTAWDVLEDMGLHASDPTEHIANGRLHWVPTERLLPGLKRLLDVRRTIGLRNPAHSIVKLMNPCSGPSLVVGSYTHPEYAVTMADTFKLTTASRHHNAALLLRGTEGEPVADARRMPRMDVIINGAIQCAQEAQTGPLTDMPDLPSMEAASTSAYTRAVLEGHVKVPEPIARQVELISQACHALQTTPSRPFA